MWDVILDALLDTLKMAPFLFLMYVLIEVIEEYSMGSINKSKIWSSKYATVVATGIGIIPQCGFSIIASEMYSTKKITMGTLLAIFVATSDEAIPILLASPQGWTKIWPLLLIKIVFAIVLGYGCDLILHMIAKTKKTKKLDYNNQSVKNIDGVNNKTITISEHEHTHDNDSNECIHTVGCCGHDVEEKNSTLKKFLLHPFLHTLKILGYILAINLILGSIIYCVTEERLVSFLASASLWQPLAASLIGLIPNCAASVIITNLYLIDGITLGSCVAGLCVNAGLGILYLFKKNKNLKQNISIVSILFISSVLVGMLVDLVLKLI